MTLIELTVEVSEWIEVAAIILEILAVAIIVISISYATARYIYRRRTHPPLDIHFEDYKITIGKTLLLGLEILVAADIVATVAIEPTFESVGILGLLVLIRTFLSWSLVVEIEGRWPWQKGREAKKGGAALEASDG